MEHDPEKELKRNLAGQESMYRYSREKLWQALGCLVGEGSLRSRLVYCQDFIARLRPDHFPDNLIPAYLSIKDIVQQVYDNELVTDDQARKAAQNILTLFTDLKGGISNPGKPHDKLS